MDDFVVRGATVLDGSESERFVADVAVQDGRIQFVGQEYQGEASETIDAGGLFLAPGFIDCHCHDDLAMLHHPDRPEKVAQGVTTVVVGNCGFSLYPSSANSKSAVQKHAGGLLGPVRPDEVFEGFSEYRDKLLTQGIGINVCSLVGHGPLRLTAVGSEDRPATEQELASMESLLWRDLEAGAAGFSLGLVYPPSSFAGREELVRLCRVEAECGKLVAAHIRGYEASLLDATHEFLEILRESGARGVLSHLQAAGRPNWGSVVRALAALDEARKEGIDVSFDMYPYLAGSSYALQLLPPSALSNGIEALKTKLASPKYRNELRARLLDAQPDVDGWQPKVAVIGWESIMVAGVQADSLKFLEGKTLHDAASETGGDPFDLLVRLVLEDDGESAVILFQLSEEDLLSAFTHPLQMVGSDGIPREVGRPHPRAFGAFPRVISHLANERGWFSLEDAVRRMTSVAAERFGMADRGQVKPGFIADLVLFEPDFRDTATFASPTDEAVGATHVWVNGRAVLSGERLTNARPGCVV